MSYATSDVTISSDDKEVSEGGIPRVIVLGYDGLPIQPVAPPSPDYIPQPRGPTGSPPIPQDESDPEEDPEEYEDDETEEDEDDEVEEEEERSTLLRPDCILLWHLLIEPCPRPSISLSTRGKSARLLAPWTTPSPSPPISLSPPSAGERLARIASTQALIDAVTAALPSPPLPPSLYIPPPVDRRDDIPESEQPPRKRLYLSTLGSRYEVGESSTSRPTKGQGIDYGFVSTVDAKERRQGIRGLVMLYLVDAQGIVGLDIHSTLDTATAAEYSYLDTTSGYEAEELSGHAGCVGNTAESSQWIESRQPGLETRIPDHQDDFWGLPTVTSCDLYYCILLGAAFNLVGNVGNAEKRGNAPGNPDANIVTGTFLLNNHYASILFDTGADRSFISTAFSSLINIAPTPLENCYEVELADGKLVGIDTIIRGCTLNFLDHPFNIDLMPVELGSFDVIIGMDWLRRCHAVIVCDEKLVQIPYGNETLTFCGNESSNGRESRLTVISCSKAQEYMAKGCQVFLAQISAKKEEDKSEGKQIKDVPIVRDFPEVFPEDLPGLPPARPVEFQIDLIPGAAPVARAPYRLAPSEMKELSEQLQELSDKGFIRPSSSPWGAPVLFVKKKDWVIQECA
ncbi:putative reverse transcriptase domain-containing protein [Tanacetum coccineum]|uniref:Reverse transcriptase domain-containing protein n=1 Tax=Tanacetum coccineum TaxID=301880 RepID=A0ABQ5ASX6_9ASTR